MHSTKWHGRHDQGRQRLGQLEFCRVQQGLLQGGIWWEGDTCAGPATPDVSKKESSPRALEREGSRETIQPNLDQGSAPNSRGGVGSALPGTAWSLSVLGRNCPQLFYARARSEAYSMSRSPAPPRPGTETRPAGWAIRSQWVTETMGRVLSRVRPQGLQPTRLLCPPGFSGKKTGVGCHALLQGMCAHTCVLLKLLVFWKEVN